MMPKATTESKAKRISSRPLKSKFEIFISSLSMNEIDRHTLRTAGAIWLEFYLAIEEIEGPAAIQYRERVYQSLAYDVMQTRMARLHDKLKNARLLRGFTHPRTLALLDQLIIQDCGINDIYRSEYGADAPDRKLEKDRLRTRIVHALEQFSYQTRHIR